jgi:hypothetical protein
MKDFLLLVTVCSSIYIVSMLIANIVEYITFNFEYLSDIFDNVDDLLW